MKSRADIMQDPKEFTDLPESIQDYLVEGVCNCIQFNRTGELLASGCFSGDIVIWDFETRGVVKLLSGHSKVVCCIRWSRDGKKLVSGSQDRCIFLWDVLTGEKEVELCFEHSISNISVDYTNYYKMVISCQFGPAYLVDLQQSSKTMTPVLGQDDTKHREVTAIAVYSRKGEFIVQGQAKGILVVMDNQAATVLDVIKINQAPRIMDVEFNRKGSCLLMNCNDGCIHALPLKELSEFYTMKQQSEFPGPISFKEAAAKVTNKRGARNGRFLSLIYDDGFFMLQGSQTFQNPVQRTPWVTATFSRDSEYVVAGALMKGEHLIYFWTLSFGTLERTLDGPRQQISDLTWHPRQPWLLSVMSGGKILIWTKAYQEHWSVFAPDFTEIAQNMEYVEKETEFDLNESMEEKQEKKKQESEALLEMDIDVDLGAPMLHNQDLSDDEKEDDLTSTLCYLPLDVDEIIEANIQNQQRVNPIGDQ